MLTPHATSRSDARLPVLDAATFAGLRELDADEAGFLDEVIAHFRAETPSRIADIRRCASRSAGAELVGAAHALKGSARTLGLLRFAEVGQQIESLGGAGRFPCAATLQRLETEFALACRALADLDGTTG